MSEAKGTGAYERESNYRSQNGSERLTGAQERRSDRKTRARVSKARLRGFEGLAGSIAAEAVVARTPQDPQTRSWTADQVMRLAGGPIRSVKLKGQRPVLSATDEVRRWDDAAVMASDLGFAAERIGQGEEITGG